MHKNSVKTEDTLPSTSVNVSPHKQISINRGSGGEITKWQKWIRDPQSLKANGKSNLAQTNEEQVKNTIKTSKQCIMGAYLVYQIEISCWGKFKSKADGYTYISMYVDMHTSMYHLVLVCIVWCCIVKVLVWKKWSLMTSEKKEVIFFDHMTNLVPFGGLHVPTTFWSFWSAKKTYILWVSCNLESSFSEFKSNQNLNF